jgi:hypothetical protein
MGLLSKAPNEERLYWKLLEAMQPQLECNRRQMEQLPEIINHLLAKNYG